MIASIVFQNWVVAQIAPPEIELKLISGADAQIGGPSYDFRIGKFEIRNDQFVVFLNDALANLSNERGQYMYFNTPDGRVFIHAAATGVTGSSGSGTLLFHPGVGGRISFASGSYRVTEAAFAAHPVVGVTWYGAAKFCNWMTLQRGMPASERVYVEGPSAASWHSVSFDPASQGTNRTGFRLPMDGGALTASPYNEWYKAASRKSGTNGFGAIYGFGRATLTNVDANFLSSTDPFEIGPSPVGYFNGINKLANNTTLTKDTENDYRLYDLCGNVAEWVHEVSDVGGTATGATRGGHFTHPATFAALRTDARESVPAASALAFVGFRVAQSLYPQALRSSQDNEEIRATGYSGGPFDRSRFILRLRNDAAYAADDVTVTMNAGWLKREGDAPIRVPASGGVDVPLVLTDAAGDLGASPVPPGAMVLVAASDMQTGGPAHDYWISITEVTNDQFAAFLNDARANKENGRGAYLYHDTDSGSVYLHVSATGAEGTAAPSAVLASLMYDAAIGRIVFRNNRYEVETGFGTHPVVGVTWYGAVKYCNWLTLFAGLPESVRAYVEGPTTADWRPLSISKSDWAVRSLTDPERRTLIDRTVGYRLPMDGETGGEHAFGECYKAASARKNDLGVIEFGAAFGFGRDALTASDANFFASGDTAIDGTTTEGFFDGANKLADGLTFTAKSGNAYNLVDACGNAAEWTQEFFTTNDPTLRATRGGSWLDSEASSTLTTTGRAGLAPGLANGWTGFRVVRGTGHIVTVTVRDNISETTSAHPIILDLREPLSVSPVEAYETDGVYCDDFSGRTFDFVITNASQRNTPWAVTVSGEGQWLRVQGPGSGALTGDVPPNGGTVMIRATTLTGANLLAAGEYKATITVRNVRTNRSSMREIRLTVDQPIDVEFDESNPPAEFSGVWGGPFETLPTLRYWMGRSLDASPTCPPEYDVRAADDWLTVVAMDPDVPLAGPLPSVSLLWPFDVSVNNKANLLPVGEHTGRVRFKYVHPSVPTPVTPIEKTIRVSVLDPIRIEGDAAPWEICCELDPGALPSRTFRLTNLHRSFAAPVSVSASVEWINLDSTALVILPDGSHQVTATLKASAPRTHGLYTATIRFTDELTQHVQTRLVRLRIIEALVVSPATDFEASSLADGPIDPDTVVYTLSNPESDDGEAILWRVSANQAWVRVNGSPATSGTLLDGASFAVVVSIDPTTAPTLPQGQSFSTHEAVISFDDLAGGETITRRVILTRVAPQLALDEVEISAAARQPNGPAYPYRMGRTDVSNAEFVVFLNDAMVNPGNRRGRHMFFETTTGDVYVNSEMNGGVGAERGERTVKMFSPTAAGQIVFVGGAYAVRMSLTDYSRHPVTGVSWFGAVKFCNWASLDQGIAPSRLCYLEDTDKNLSGWRPAAIAATDWTQRDLNDSERLALVTQYRGYRLPMDDGYNNATPTTDAADDYNEWYKAAAWNDATRQNMVFGFGRNAIAGMDANYRCSGDPFEGATDCNVGGSTPSAYYDGTVKNGGFVTRGNANGFALFDMTGNVHQWMQDRYAPPASLDRRSLRGGSWNEAIGAAALRNASRPMFALAGTVSSQIGFRVSRSVETARGDANADGRVDAADWAALTACHLGPAAVRTQACFAFDFDGDGRVDLRDVSQLQRAISPAGSM